MEMPDDCGNCKYRKGRFSDKYYTCKLLDITYPSEPLKRFALCPLREVKK